nr:glycolate oxidase subunit GlcE [Ramlibacter sp.]
QAACRSLGGERLDGAQAAAQWQACREQQLPWFAEAGGRDLWRLSVPQTAAELDLGAPSLIEWHGAQRWVHAPAGDAERLRRIAKDTGGHATLFRTSPDAAAGLARFQALAAPLDRIHAKLKREFDPVGVFNPGRLFPNF